MSESTKPESDKTTSIISKLRLLTETSDWIQENASEEMIEIWRQAADELDRLRVLNVANISA